MTKPNVEVIFLPRFQRNAKRLAKKYRGIRADVEGLVERLRQGETPGDQISGVGYTAYKV